MGLRKLKRSIAKADMKKAGIIQPNKSSYKSIDQNGNPGKQHTSSFFAAHWRDRVEHKEDKNADNQDH